MERREDVIIRNKKEEIRKEISKRLCEQDPLSRERKSKVIREKLLALKEFQGSKTVMTYVSLPTEVDTWSLNKVALEQGKRVAVPYIEPNRKVIAAAELTTLRNLKKGPFGIYQPEESCVSIISLKEIDLIVVPAIAYDKQNMRLGRGKGFYDRFLSAEDLSLTVKIGLAFSFQIVEHLPITSYDVSVSRIITEF